MVKFGPWAPDQPYTDGAMIDVCNAISYAGKYRALPTESEVSVSLVTGALNGFSSRLVNGNSKTYIGTASKIWERSGAGWTDVSNGTYTLASGSRWEFAQYSDDIYAVSIDETMQNQTGATGAFTDVSGGPKAACIGNVRQFIVVGDVDESGTLYPHKVRWCAIDNPADWTPAEATQAGAQELDAQDGRVMAIKGGEFGIILQQNAITRMVYIGAPIVWQFDKIDSRHGCEVAGSAVRVGREVYFLSHDGWRVTDGSGQSVNIGQGMINKWFRDNLMTGSKQKIRGAYNPDWRSVVWTFPSSNGGGANDSLLIYSIDDKRWTRGNYGLVALWDGSTNSVTLEGLDSYFATLEDVTPNLDDPFWLGGEGKFQGMNATGYLVTLDNTPGTATFETNDSQLTQSGTTRVQGIEPVIDGTTTVQVGYKTLPADTITYTAAQGVTARTGIASFQIAARWLRAKFSVSGSFFDAVGFNIMAKGQGRG